MSRQIVELRHLLAMDSRRRGPAEGAWGGALPEISSHPSRTESEHDAMDTVKDTPPQAPIGMQFGPYLLRQRLGLGGMASVWKAIDDRGRTLVVKRILPALAEDPEF